MSMLENLLRVYSKKQLKTAVADSQSIAQVLQTLGIEVRRSGYRKIQLLSSYYKIELPKYEIKVNGQTFYPGRQKYSDKEFFSTGTDWDGKQIKKRLIRLGVPEKCNGNDCPVVTSWLGVQITLQVDHINGNHNDNRFENLQLLCPNCHSQTSTYGNKGKKYFYCDCGRIKTKDASTCMVCYRAASHSIINWDSIEKIVASVEQMGYTTYASKIGVTDNAVRKHLRSNGVNPLPHKRGSK